jgi:citrate lyase subunit beta / citryl-CoA lyase
MANSSRPRRSILYMPGSNARALDKGRTLPADALIIDLEDSVAPDAKAEARQQIVAALGEGGYGGRELTIRVNALTTPWGFDDIATISGTNADAILIPKVDSAEAVHQAASIMNSVGAPETMAIWCMMETPRAILHAEEIADSHSRMGAFVMGTSDLAKDLGAAHTETRLPFMMTLNMCVLAARAAGLAILDGVHLDLNDDEGFRASCVQGRELGFDGKTLIHPKTIAAANEVFGPSEDELAWSQKIIEAHAGALKEGKGVVVVEGKLVENLHVESAKRLVAMAEAIRELESR